ncbi:hypothetical protein [Streptomyces sp. 769]|uniref:hypothetical protein n=1 Tax=Streptomyces sp. 769 TaxID=1262452 RepID=UPI000581BD21|nr:hypothetical protein [Streptomyces sp. 769]AJC54012.1 hypothetical protein GZL_01412 [Streptomyces sp. 769]
MAKGAKALIAEAKKHVGFREGPNNQNPFSAHYGRDHESWCADFVSYCGWASGNHDVIPNYSYCPNGVAYYRSKGRFSEYPVIGGPVFYGPGGSHHTGICIGYTADTITTIEGNTNNDGSAEGNGVYLKSRSRKSTNVYGYGIPDFPEGVVLADPAWKGKVGVVYFGQEASAADIPSGGQPDPKPDPQPGPTPTPGGDMPKSVWLHNGTHSKVQRGEWMTVDVTANHDGTIVPPQNRDQYFTSNVKLQVSGVEAGATIRGRFLKFKPNGDPDGGYSEVEQISTVGDSFLGFSACGHMNPKASLMFQMQVDGSGDAIVVNRTAEALYW